MEARRLLQVQNTGLIQENKQLLPHAEYCKTVLTSTSTYVTDQIAKEMGMTATALNKKLKELDVQFKRGKQWVLTSKYCDKGYTSTNTFSQTNNGETRTYMNTVWTERGRKFIHEIISNLK